MKYVNIFTFNQSPMYWPESIWHSILRRIGPINRHCCKPLWHLGFLFFHDHERKRSYAQNLGPNPKPVEANGLRQANCHKVIYGMLQISKGGLKTETGN